MASVRAGVVTAVEVNGPAANPSPGPLFDPKSGGFWCGAWFVIAILVLFLVL